MKKALFSFLFIFGIFFSFYSFAETVPTIEKDSELIDIDIKYSFCFEYPISQEAAEICMDDFDPERFAVCSLYPRDAVAQAICLKDKSITARNVIDCSLAQTNMAEQYCLLNNPNLNTLDSIKTAIEEITGFTVQLLHDSDSDQVFFIFPSTLEFHIIPDEIEPDQEPISPTDQNFKGELKMAGIVTMQTDFDRLPKLIPTYKSQKSSV